MTRKNFTKQVKRVEEPFAERAGAIWRYIEDRVFGEQRWGALVRDLRNKIAHVGELYPGEDGDETAAGIFLDWPTVQGLTLERLAQDFQNGAFDLFADLAEPLFLCKWKAGSIG